MLAKKKRNFPCFHFYGYNAFLHHFFPRNMAREHESLVNCLRYKSVDELTEFSFETPSFLTSMGPSRDGVLIPSDFGIDTSYSSNNIRKRAHASTYQASLTAVSGAEVSSISREFPSLTTCRQRHRVCIRPMSWSLNRPLSVQAKNLDSRHAGSMTNEMYPDFRLLHF